MKIKKGDNVIAIAGRDKGKTGKVERVLRQSGRVIVSRLNLVKSHQKPKRSDQKGQIIEKSMPLHISNVMILDPKDNKPTRVGKKVIDGKKIRVARRSQQPLD